MKRILFRLFLCTVVAGLLAPVPAVGQDTADARGFLITFDGDAEAVAAEIQSLGGQVKIRYRNVKAMAATFPASKLSAVKSLAGVTTVEKDALIGLPEDGKGSERPLSYTVENVDGVQVEALDFGALDLDALPDGYANFLYTGAVDVWGTTAGDGSIVAVVDTGTARNFCLSNAVIGASGYPDGYNASGDGVPATSPLNHWHGTHVGGVIASNCSLDFSAAPSHPIYLAVAEHLGWPVDFVPILGQAPESQIYPVKVFNISGASTPTSVILEGLDHILTLKKDDVLDIDVVNMSLGGPTGYDGRDAYDRFMAELKKAKMLVVTSAGNEGPIPNTVGSPATSFSTLSVGATDVAASSRTFYEYLGLAVWPLAPGQGMVMRPTDETRIVNYSSRGPLSDGRAGPDISALGHWNFHEGPGGELRWAGGTSFASPTVAGAAALLNAWWEAKGKETDPGKIRNALLYGADRREVAKPWRRINDQGWGVLDASKALEILDKWGRWLPRWFFPIHTGKLEPNVLDCRHRWHHTGDYESDEVILNPSEKWDAVFKVRSFTSKITIEIFDIKIPDNFDFAYWANAIEVNVQSAKRSSASRPIDSFLWYPWYGDSLTIEIEDGPWTFAGLPWADQPMEPGLMKVSLAGDYSNESAVSFKVRIARENVKKRLRHPRAVGRIRAGDTFVIPVTIPDGAASATFDLKWGYDWSRFPTNDLDMLVFDKDGFLVPIFDGATLNAPERLVLTNPTPGVYYIQIDAYEVHKRDFFKLFVTLN